MQINLILLVINRQTTVVCTVGITLEKHIISTILITFEN